jgi:hypothetical protein
VRAATARIEQIIACAGVELDLIRVPDEALPEDLGIVDHTIFHRSCSS